MRVLFAVLILLLASPALASSPPIPPKKGESLSSINKQMEAQKSEQEDLEKQAKSLEKGMKGLKKDLISIAGKVQDYETSMRELEERLSQLRKNKSDLTNSLSKQKKSIADLVLALERIRRLPPETLVARPDAPLETAQAATVLSSILPELDSRAKRLKLDLDELQKIEGELTDKQASLKETTEKLKTDQVKLDKLMDEREKSLKDTKKQVAKREESIAQLSKSAKDLSDLIAKVDEKNRILAQRADESRTQNARSSRPTSPQIEQAMQAALPSLGNSRLPVSGIIKTRFGQTDDIGAKSQGLTIEARPGTVVVAPLGGIVRYAGPFKKYGSIILLEHKNKFHSLVAGLGKIDTFVGQSVDAGEPLGRLPDYTGRLYYELRYRGAPVNPAQKFAKLE
ncbi:MAG TPA: peptidoglycan DD-metalloendopeptidase family protein [Alphaproteobacteria bacterium]|nr:peptidoglycan DD-metalloendopeptidase family protein [Alphaproteobacteria bacterium]